MREKIAQLPKIELHCHLDGSLDLRTTQRLLEERGEIYSLEELQDKMQVPENCQNLAEYLERFALPNHCLQDQAGLRESAYALAKNAAAENVTYLEVRFAPAFSMAQGMQMRDIVESVQQGLLSAKEETGIETGIILCMMRGMEDSVNYQVLDTAREMLGNGVVACDIAGDEASYPLALQRELFQYAKKKGLPFTIHAGETGNAENVKEAIALGTRRLGHGVAMVKSPELMMLCAEKKIGVELCPTSNVQTKAYEGYRDCPVQRFMSYGIPISVNTDNRTVSHATCTDEMLRMMEYFSFTQEDLHKIYVDSIEMSFATEEMKHRLLEKWR